jgi:NADH-quinone oxidoreductase subunit J
MIQILLLIALVIFSILAVLIRDLLKAAISLAVASIFLAIIFFRMNAIYAGVFELSVVAGLITVLFISTIALTKGSSRTHSQEGEEQNEGSSVESKQSDKLVRDETDVRESKVVSILFPIFFVLFIIIDIIIMKTLINRLTSAHFPAPAGNFGQVLWGTRTLDLVGQIGVIFAGVFAVIALFRKRDKKDE